MPHSSDRLYELLPVVIRQRDLERGQPLRALLQVIGEQVDHVEQDIDRLYDNWFMETCEDWVIPYIGELVGYEPGFTGGGGAGAGHLPLAAALSSRSDVANTIRNQRRKGSFKLLERLVLEAAGWPARAVEFYKLLALMQPINHLRLDRGRTADLRASSDLALVDGPFEATAHTVDVRNATARRRQGRYNIPSVGIFLWRLQSYRVTREPAYCLEGLGSNAYTFSILGNDIPLFAKADRADALKSGANATNLPVPITRRLLEKNVEGYYGIGKSFAIWADGWEGNDPTVPVPASALIAADLSSWSYTPHRGTIAVDPELGRIAFHHRQMPRKGVWVRYRYGFSDDIGGGEYPRQPTEPRDAVAYRVGADVPFVRINDALAKWRDDDPDHAVVEIVDGGVYSEQIGVELRPGQSLQLRSCDRRRATLRLMDWHTSRPDSLHVRGEAGSRFTLDGLLVTGRGVQVEGSLAEVTLRHVTLVPGWSLDPSCEPTRPAQPSLELLNCTAKTCIERSIIGSIQVSLDEVGSDPVPIAIADSIVDATSDTREAVGAPSWPLAHAVLDIRRSTVFGETQTHAILLAEDSIFTGAVRVARRQIGCMRFCYVPPGSRTPRRFRCQPDLAEAAALANLLQVEIAPPATVALAASSEQEAEEARARPAANLDLRAEGGGTGAAIGGIVRLTVTVENRGPRAGELNVVLSLPLKSDGSGAPCLDVQELTVSQGQPPADGKERRWAVGQLAPSQRAMLGMVAEIVAVCDPPAVNVAIARHSFSDDGSDYRRKVRSVAARKVVPRFTSKRYGQPGYAQLSLTNDPGILEGASDSSEMGVFHDLMQPQRINALRVRLGSYVPAGIDVGLFFAS